MRCDTKKLLILGIFIILFTNLFYAVADSLDVADSSYTSQHEANPRDIRPAKGAFGLSAGRVFGIGWTFRKYLKKFAVQGSIAIIPDFLSDDPGNNYSFGLCCLYNVSSSSHMTFYLTGGTTFVLNSHDEKNWFLGLAPAIDFSLPYLEFISFNIGYSITYPILDQGLDEDIKGFKLFSEYGVYIRIF